MKNKYLNHFFYGFALFAALMQACNEKNNEKQEMKAEAPPIEVPTFNSDSAYHFIQEQVDFGPRVPNTEAHRETGDYIIRKLEGYGIQVTVQDFEATAFDGTKLYLKNIIGSYKPDSKKRILLAAHWDTRPFADKDSVRKDEPIDGANDGGSGVGVLLEIARVVGENQDLDLGIDFIFFDGEDYGMTEDYKSGLPAQNQEISWCLGSQYWSKNLHEPNYSAFYGILLDMVGAENARFYREGFSVNNAASIVKTVWDQAHQIGYGEYFVYRDGPPVTDDHVFINVNAHIPTIDIIEYSPGTVFGSYHHTHADNMDIISKNTLKAVGETVLHVLYNEQVNM